MKDLNSIVGVAENYSKELDAKFRTLSLIVKHGGEIGRAHEQLIHEVLTRFLPPRIRVASGFLSAPEWVSGQQDVIMFDNIDFPTLFEVGDCVVAVCDSLVGVIEVKTDLDSKSKYLEALRALPNIDAHMHYRRAFTALYLWGSLSLVKTLEVIEEFIEEDPAGFRRLPSFICAKGKFVLLKSGLQLCKEYSYKSVNIGSKIVVPNGPGEWQITDGTALLMLVSEIFRAGSLWGGPLAGAYPWWLGNWNFPKRRHKLPDTVKPLICQWFDGLDSKTKELI